ncbi:replication initiation factor domain-containing protein [Listeria goaensis]|uniref:replication initiation factor domain-containing protein n=1 Tax=Listeria goaensis TaxID=1649188 RepID=UPI0013C2A754|nr:replication initiation factor domain-containing protein [Listeria goaensis]
MKRSVEGRMSNTALEIPKKQVKKEIKIGVDWVTAILDTAKISTVLQEIMYIKKAHWIQKNGRKQYKEYTQVYELGDIRVFAHPYPSEENPHGLGCCIEMSGKGCGQFAEILQRQKRDWRVFFQACISENARFSRLDIAIDDRNETPYFTLDQLIQKARRREYRSQTRSVKVIESSCGDGFAYTLNLGKRKSALMYRFYEKNKEQAEKTGLPVDHFGSWNRTEVEMKKEIAQAFVQKIIEPNQSLDQLIRNLLYENLCFLSADPYQQNKSRWKVWRPWERFLGDVQSLNFTLETEENTLADTYRWLERGGVVGTIKALLILEEKEVLQDHPPLNNLIQEAKISDPLMTKLSIYLTEKNRLDVLPDLEKEAKNPAYALKRSIQ